MKTLIAYESKYGCVKRCAEELREQLKGEVVLIRLSDKMPFILSEYDQVIIGGSIYMGKIQKEITAFCQRYSTELEHKRVGLFICGMQEGLEAEQELINVFPKVLLDQAKVKGVFGGAFNLEAMGLINRMIVKKAAGVTESVSKVEHLKISEFAESMNE